MSTEPYFDAVVLGGGLLGCFAARHLSAYRLRCALVEAREDVCTGISRGNSAIVYTGCDNKPGTLKARFNLEGSRMYEGICRELGTAFRRCGAFVAAASPEEEGVLKDLLARAQGRGIPAQILGREEALRRIDVALAKLG